MKKVYFVRHGLTQFNTESRVQDGNDALSEKGLEQAKDIADRLTRVPFDLLLSSDMLRAKQTAEKIAERTGHTPSFSPLFAEAKYPTSFVGLSYKEDAIQKYLAERDREGRYEDEETPAMLHARAKEALTDLAARDEESIAVVTHGRFLRHIILAVLLGDTATWEQEEYFINHLTASNTGITVLEYNEGTWRMITWNDHAHLG